MARAYATLRKKSPRAFEDLVSSARGRMLKGLYSETEATDDLTDWVFSVDEVFARAVFARFVRDLLREPPGRAWPDRDVRMRRVVELRAEGLSIRKISQAMGVPVGTVHSDLSRWSRDHSNVSPAAFNSTVQSKAFNAVQSGAEPQEEAGGLNAPAEHATVTLLRRSS